MTTIRPFVPSEKIIKAHVRTLLFHGPVRCPRCAHLHPVSRSEKRYRCATCRRPFSLTSVSWLRGMKMSWSQCWILLWCFCRRYQPRQAAEISGVSLPTVRHWYRRFRTHLPERARKLHVLVCADEAYIGKRKTGNQRIVAGAVEPQTKEVRLRIIPDTDQDSIELFLWHNVDPVTLVRTDAHTSYTQIEWMGYGHDWEVHERGQLEKTVPIERVWSFSKWHLRRMYHHVWARNLPLFLREIEWRFSTPETFASPLSFLQISLTSVPTAC